jgi:hypothetical protein
MKKNVLFIGLVVLGFNAYSAEKPKAEHMHVAKHNGKVLMLGDVHFEVTGDEKMLMIYYYDRFGDELATSKIDVNFEIVEGAKRSKVEGVKDKTVSNLVHLSLPNKTDKNVAELFIKAKNVDMPKGQLVGATLLKFALKSLGPSVEADPHAGHHM